MTGTCFTRSALTWAVRSISQTPTIRSVRCQYRPHRQEAYLLTRSRVKDNMTLLCGKFFPEELRSVQGTFAKQPE
jgi:hypothetical protein